MTKRDMIKTGIKTVVSIGVGEIVMNAVSYITPPTPMGLLKRAMIGIGAFAIGLYAGDKVSDYTELKIEEVFQEIDKAKEKATA